MNLENPHQVPLKKKKCPTPLPLRLRSCRSAPSSGAAAATGSLPRRSNRTPAPRQMEAGIHQGFTRRNPGEKLKNQGVLSREMRRQVKGNAMEIGGKSMEMKGETLGKSMDMRGKPWENQRKPGENQGKAGGKPGESREKTRGKDVFSVRKSPCS